MVNWSEKRQKAGVKFVRQGIRTAMDPSIGNMALLAYRGVKGLRAIVNSEELVLDRSVSTTLVSGTANIYQINYIDQGDQSYERTGLSVLMTRMSVNESYQIANTANTVIREIYFYDKQQISDTAPTASDILQDPTSAYSLYNRVIKGRFQILSDRQFVLCGATNPLKVRKFSKTLKKHALFNGTTGVDIQKNGLYVLRLSYGADCVQVGKVRLGYHDN